MIDQPNVFERDGEWLRAALHTHSTVSDGDLTPLALARQYTTAGFDILAITDHWRLATVADPPDLVMVPAAELTADLGEVTRRRTDFRFTTTGLVHHSDAVSQYTSLAFTDALHQSGIAGSIGSVGDALDNALMESAIGLYKTELIDRHRPWTGRSEVERETATRVHWYNTTRLHSSLGYSSPTAYEDRYRDTVTSTPEVA